MKNNNIKGIVLNVLTFVIIMAVLIVVANLFIFLLPIFFFMAIVYYLYQLFFKEEIRKRRSTNFKKTKFDDEVKEAKVVKEKIDD